MNFQTKNEGAHKQQMSLLMEKVKLLEERNAELEKQNKILAEKALNCDLKKMEKVVKQNKELTKTVNVLKNKIKIMEKENNKLRELHTNLQKNFSELKKRLKRPKGFGIVENFQYLQPRFRKKKEQSVSKPVKTNIKESQAINLNKSIDFSETIFLINF